MLTTAEGWTEKHSSRINLATRLFIATVIAYAGPVVQSEAQAQGAERGGKEVVDAVCVTCHGAGAYGAPRIGDEKAWARLASRGLTGLTESALKGIRNMPPHGGNPALTDIEIARAITYMVNRSGGHWTEPISRTTSPVERSGEQIVQAQCVNCHETGVGGAPRIGDRAAWTPRLKQGLDVAIRSAIKGHGSMPPRGGLADLTDAEIRAAVLHMFNPSGEPKAETVARAASPDPNRKVIEGTEIYLGVVPAASIRARHPKPDAEGAMHGGAPRGTGYYHVNISLLDSTTGAEVKDARVEVKVAHPVVGGESKRLDRMEINNTVSYGNYFRMPGKDAYTITVLVERPGMSRAIEARFDFKPY